MSFVRWMSASILAMGMTPVSSTANDWADPLQKTTWDSLKRSIEKVEKPQGTPMLVRSSACEPFDQIRARYIQDAERLLQKHATEIRAQIIPSADEKANDILRYLSAESIAKFQETSGKLLEQTVGKPSNPLTSYLQFHGGPEWRSVTDLLIRDFTNERFVAAITNYQEVWVFERRTLSKGSRFDFELDASPWQLFGPKPSIALAIRRVDHISLTGSPLPRIDVNLNYPIHIDGEGKPTIQAIASSADSDEKVVQSARIEFADPQSPYNFFRYVAIAERNVPAQKTITNGAVSVLYPIDENIRSLYNDYFYFPHPKGDCTSLNWIP